MTFDDFIEKLEVVGESGGHLRAICPAHEKGDKGDLQVTDGGDRILLHCFGNCTTQDIVRALDLQFSDLFYDNAVGKSRGRDLGDPERIYVYTDANGKDLFQVLRYPSKDFRQRHYDPNHEKAKDDGWVWSLDGVSRVLFRLPQVIEAIREERTVFLCEGEKDVEAFEALGFTATCNPGGAGKWREEYTEMLRGANVVIVADRDEPGRAHATKVKDSLLGAAKSIWVVQAKQGKDAHDHLVKYSLPPEQFVPVKERMRRGTFTSGELAEDAREYLELGEADFPSYKPWPVPEGVKEGPVAIRPGRPYFIGGYTGDGKTALMLQAVRAIAEDGIEKGRDVNIGIYSNEMTRRDLVNRLVSHEEIPLHLLDTPWLIKGGPHEAAYMQALEKIEAWNLSVTFNPTITPKEVVEGTINLEHDIVFFDHLHRVRWGNERRSFEDAVIQFTNLALDYNIPVVVLAQLRRFQRGQNMEAYPRPMLQDFRESEMIGMEAAMALAVWRVRDHQGLQYDPSGTTELIVLKDRYGAPRSYFYSFNGEKQLFGLAPMAPPDPPAPPPTDAYNQERPSWLEEDK